MSSESSFLNPRGYVGYELGRVLPRLYLVYVLGAAGGIAAGLPLGGPARTVAFLCVYAVLSLTLSPLLLGRRAAETLYPALAERRFGRLLLIGVTIFGALMAIAFSGLMMLEFIGRPILMAAAIGGAVAISAVVGLVFGAFVYLVRRFGEP